MSEDNEPLYTLQEAVKRFLPGGRWTVASLRTERRKGRLKVEKIAGKIGVTESAIREMRMRCREQPSRPVSTSAPVPIVEPTGLSSTADANLARAAAKQTARELIESSRNTSRKSTRHRAQVVELQTRSSQT